MLNCLASKNLHYNEHLCSVCFKKIFIYSFMIIYLCISGLHKQVSGI